MKKLIYKNKDITDSIEINSAIIVDNAGDKADTIDLVLSDVQKNWREYPPIQGDTIELIYDNFKSGTMYIDEFCYTRGKINITAISAPIDAKKSKTRVFEKISFNQLAIDLTKELGIDVEFFNINNFSYNTLEQNNITNLDFLEQICMLEGYKLKIFNNKAVIYDELYFENNSCVDTLSEGDFIGDYFFKCVNNKIYSSCTVQYENIKSTCTSKEILQGSTLVINTIKLNTLMEAERFSKNILKYHNKKKYSGKFKTSLKAIAAGSNIYINDLGVFSGKNFIERIEHNLVSNVSVFKVRKVLEVI